MHLLIEPLSRAGGVHMFRSKIHYAREGEDIKSLRGRHSFSYFLAGLQFRMFIRCDLPGFK